TARITGYIGLEFAVVDPLIRIKRSGYGCKNAFNQHDCIVKGRRSPSESPISLADSRGRVQILQRVDRNFMLLHGGYPFKGSLSRGNRRDGRDPRKHSRPANRLFIEEGVLTARRIDDELNPLTLD